MDHRRQWNESSIFDGLSSEEEERDVPNVDSRRRHHHLDNNIGDIDLSVYQHESYTYRYKHNTGQLKLKNHHKKLTKPKTKKRYDANKNNNTSKKFDNTVEVGVDDRSTTSSSFRCDVKKKVDNDTDTDDCSWADFSSVTFSIGRDEEKHGGVSGRCAVSDRKKLETSKRRKSNRNKSKRCSSKVQPTTRTVPKNVGVGNDDNDTFGFNPTQWEDFTSFNSTWEKSQNDDVKIGKNGNICHDNNNINNNKNKRKGVMIHRSCGLEELPHCLDKKVRFAASNDDTVDMGNIGVGIETDEPTMDIIRNDNDVDNKTYDDQSAAYSSGSSSSQNDDITLSNQRLFSSSSSSKRKKIPSSWRQREGVIRHMFDSNSANVQLECHGFSSTSPSSVMKCKRRNMSLSSSSSSNGKKKEARGPQSHFDRDASSSEDRTPIMKGIKHILERKRKVQQKQKSPFVQNRHPDDTQLDKSADGKIRPLVERKRQIERKRQYAQNQRSDNPLFVLPSEKRTRINEAGDHISMNHDSVGVAVEATCICELDAMIQRGGLNEDIPTPFVPGCNFVGIVQHCGPGAVSRGIYENCRVAALSKYGSNAQYVTTDVDKLVLVPKELDPPEVACAISIWLPAFQALQHGVCSSLRYSSDSLEMKLVLIVCDSSLNMECQAAIRLAYWAGAAEVYAVGKREYHDQLSKLGATPLDEDPANWLSVVNGMMDVVLHYDYPRNMPFVQSAMARTGRLVCRSTTFNKEKEAGFSWAEQIEQWCEAAFLSVTMEQSSIYDPFGSLESCPDRFQQDASFLFVLLSQRQIRPTISSYIPLHKIPDAHIELQKGGMNGAIICEPWRES